jgi:hypothetical protein
VPETKAGKNRLHLDLYPTGRDNALPMERRIEIVEANVAEPVRLGASVTRRAKHDDPTDEPRRPVRDRSSSGPLRNQAVIRVNASLLCLS